MILLYQIVFYVINPQNIMSIFHTLLAIVLALLRYKTIRGVCRCISAVIPSGSITASVFYCLEYHSVLSTVSHDSKQRKNCHFILFPDKSQSRPKMYCQNPKWQCHFYNRTLCVGPKYYKFTFNRDIHKHPVWINGCTNAVWTFLNKYNTSQA